MFWALVLIAPMLASAALPRVTVENTDPELAEFAKGIVPLCEEWYPKIAKVLYGTNLPKPPEEIRVVLRKDKSVGYTQGNTIYLSAEEAKRPAKLDFRAVVIHELVHVAQGYPEQARCDSFRIIFCALARKHYWPNWPNEAIADYFTYTFYTGTNRPLLRLGADGQLQGYDESIPYLYGLQQNRMAVNARNEQRGVAEGKGYQHGYTVTASFLLWVQEQGDRAGAQPQFEIGKVHGSILEEGLWSGARFALG
jgi:hypothetical protein